MLVQTCLEHCDLSPSVLGLDPVSSTPFFIRVGVFLSVQVFCGLKIAFGEVDILMLASHLIS